MNPPEPAMEEGAARAPEPGLVRGAWLLLALVLARAGVVFALELAHHGKPGLAGLRLVHALGGMGLAAAVLVLATVAAARVLGDGLGSRAGRLTLFFPLGVAVLLFLWGRLDPDTSRRIGLDTGLGRVAFGLVSALALVLTLGAVRESHRPSRARAALVPLVLLGLLTLGLRLAFGTLGDTMEVRRVEEELLAGTWEVVRSHPEAEPEVGVLCPSPRYSPEGAGRPALILAPPALVRRTLPASAGPLWLRGAAGIDQSVEAELAERFPGHSVRLRVRRNGSIAKEARLALRGSHAWVSFGEELEVAGGDRLELETALLDASGAEVRPDVPLRTGFGELLLERREQLARTRSSAERPNLVLILLDTLRADRTSAYGCERPTTPNLEALARRGVLFEEVDATASWTWPSTASILTGLYPQEHGVEDAASSFLSERIDTLAEALQRAGFTTAAWSGSPLIVPDKGFAQGFELFDASREGRLRRSDLVLPGALEWLATARDWRFFLYLHLMEPHAPYVPLEEGRSRFASEVPRDFDPRKAVDWSWELQREGFTMGGAARTAEVVPPEEQRWIHDLYDGCVWSADHYVGLLLARLEALGLTEKTIVVVTSDHGEELFDHGLLAHGHSLHRELVRVPLILAGPGLPRGERVGTRFTAAAIGPTLARLGGGAIDGLGEERAAELDLLGPARDEPSFFSTRQGWWNGVSWQPLFGLRAGTSVLHFAPQGRPWGEKAQGGPGEVRLYDTTDDLGEQHDLAGREPERAAALRDELLRRLAGFELRRVATGGVPDEGTLQRLRELGYTGD